MQDTDILLQLKDYFVKTVLSNENIGLDETTPLLEWGVINSLEIMRLLGFIQKQFGVNIPPDKLVADSFVNLSAITNLVVENSHSMK